MSTEQTARYIRDIQNRLDLLESTAHLNYAKGTYTPTYLGGTTVGVTTYTFQAGGWRRVGNQLTVVGQINWSAATGTGDARISLPIAPSGFNFAGSLWISAVTFANGTPQLQANAGNTYFIMNSPLTNAGSPTIQIEAAGTVIWTATYFV